MSHFQNAIYAIRYHNHGRDAFLGKPHRDESIEMIQFWSDGGYFIVGKHIFPIKSRSILIADAMETHYSNPDEPADYERSNIVVSKEFFYLLCEICGISKSDLDTIMRDGAAFYHCTNITNWVLAVDHHMEDAARYFEHPDKKFAQLGIVSSLVSILNLVFPRLDTTKSQDSTSTIDLLAYYINSHGNNWQDITMEKISKSLNISPSYAGHLVKKLTGKSLTQYITMLRMTEAKRLLLSSNNRIKDISSVLGFDNTTTFCRYFKKYVGYTPQEYRKSGGISIEYADL